MAGYTWNGKKPAKRNPALEEYERGIVANADYFTATIFRGVGKFDRRQCATLELARAAAKELATGGTRPAGIYAVKNGRDVLIENYDPPKKG